MSKVNKKKMYNTIYDKIIAITSSLKKLLYHSCISALEGYGPLPNANCSSRCGVISE